jgi:hypothetical protein
MDAVDLIIVGGLDFHRFAGLIYSCDGLGR